MNRWIGRWMMGVGVFHTVIGFILYHAQLREIAGIGFWNSLNPGTPILYLAFWFFFAGVAAILIGYLTDWIEKSGVEGFPVGLGWTLLGIALAGVIVTPLSGFWLVFPAAFGALARSRATPLV